MARPVRLVLTAVLAGVLATLLSGPPAAASPNEARPRQVVERAVVFEVSNVNSTSVACVADGETYQLRGRLVGPRNEVLGADADRVNVLVHDTATGGWFWNLRQHPRYDYATQLARRGETSLVLDRLGYDRSPLADGNATCLGAQADMLHQVVQHLRSAKYAFANSDARAPSAQRVVLHGHSLGASIAQVEAATYDDVDALVVMSWADNGPSQFAVDAASSSRRPVSRARTTRRSRPLPRRSAAACSPPLRGRCSPWRPRGATWTPAATSSPTPTTRRPPGPPPARSRPRSSCCSAAGPADQRRLAAAPGRVLPVVHVGDTSRDPRRRQRTAPGEVGAQDPAPGRELAHGDPGLSRLRRRPRRPS